MTTDLDKAAKAYAKEKWSDQCCNGDYCHGESCHEVQTYDAFQAGARWGIEEAAKVADAERASMEKHAEQYVMGDEMWRKSMVCASTAAIIRNAIRALGEGEKNG